MRLSIVRAIASLSLAAALALSAARADAARPVDVRRTRITEDAVYAPIGPGGVEVKLTLDFRHIEPRKGL